MLPSAVRYLVDASAKGPGSNADHSILVRVFMSYHVTPHLVCMDRIMTGSLALDPASSVSIVPSSSSSPAAVNTCSCAEHVAQASSQPLLHARIPAKQSRPGPPARGSAWHQPTNRRVIAYQGKKEGRGKSIMRVRGPLRKMARETALWRSTSIDVLSVGVWWFVWGRVMAILGCWEENPKSQ